MLILKILYFFAMVMTWTKTVFTIRQFSKAKILELREEVRGMFQHAYDGYLKYASDYDELRPLTCDGVNTWGSYSLTLIDALDTLATMGNFTEFRRVAKLLEKKMNFDKDINVSVFETNIRIVGGLIGAHLMSKRAGVEIEVGWPCTGPLLRMAEDVARRLLPAFDTATGMPYGTVNLRYGIPRGETSITCTAGVGTFLVEFGALSRLTGNPIYEEVALNAVHSLWEHRSAIGLFGNHIDVQTGRWSAQDAGIGAGVDSFYEYLVKGAMMLNRPHLLEMFHEARKSIDNYLKRDDWYVWASMHKGQITLPVFQSLEAYWPGVLSLIGDIKPAIGTMSKYNSVWRQYGFLPEFYNIPAKEASANRESYPLRPELAESAMYLYRTTKNKFLLEVGENMIRSIQYSAKTPCGYATIRNVITHEKENRMESFFLAETTKYLYLLFDEDNFLHNDAKYGEHLRTPNGDCVIHSGPYIFNTEAHPVDVSALFCCHDIHDINDIFDDVDVSDLGKMFREAEQQELEEILRQKEAKYTCDSPTINEDTVDRNKNDSKISIDIEVFDENNNPAADELIRSFDKIRNERESSKTQQNIVANTQQLTVADLTDFFSVKREMFPSPEKALEYVIAFMKKFTLDPSQIIGLQIFDKNILANLGAVEKDYEKKSKTLWELFQMKKKYEVNAKLIQSLGLLTYENENHELLNEILQSLNTMTEYKGDVRVEPKNAVEQKIHSARVNYEEVLVNTTYMQEFLLRILINGTENKNRTYKAILSEDEITSLSVKLATIVEAASRDIFENLYRVIKFKQRLVDTIQKLQTVLDEENNKKLLTKQVPKVVDNSRQDIENKNVENPYFNGKVDKPNDVYYDKNVAKTKTIQTEDSDSNNSIWSQLVQTILRTTTSAHRSSFNESEFAEKTRISLGNYANVRQNYTLFSCPAQSFISKFAFRDYYP